MSPAPDTAPINLIASGAFIDGELAAEFGDLPPAFLPVGGRRLYALQIETLAALDGDIFLSLPESFTPSTWDLEFLERAGVRVVLVPEGLSLGQSLIYALNEIGRDAPLRLLHGDTLFPAGLPAGTNLVSTADTGFSYSWGYVDATGGFRRAELSEDPPADARVLTGFFAFDRAFDFVRALTRSRGRFVESLNAYSAPLTPVELKPWLDFGHLQTYFESRSFITTQRAFNALEVTRRYVEKWSDWSEKIEAEAYWYEHLPGDLRVFAPTYLGAVRRGDGRSAYRLEHQYSPTLHDLYVYGRLTERGWTRVMSATFEALEAFLASRGDPGVQRPLAALTLDKTLTRLEACAGEGVIGGLEAEWRLDGRTLPGLRRIAELAAARVDLETDRFHGVMHGDFCFANMFYDSRQQRLKAIDARGHLAPGVPSVFGDLRYDLAKLNHSLEGYDLILAGMFSLEGFAARDLSLSFAHDPHRDIAARVARGFTLADRRIGDAENKALTVHLFLSMLPLHADRPDRQQAFLANALRLFSELDAS